MDNYAEALEWWRNNINEQERAHYKSQDSQLNVSEAQDKGQEKLRQLQTPPLCNINVFIEYSQHCFLFKDFHDWGCDIYPKIIAKFEQICEA